MTTSNEHKYEDLDETVITNISNPVGITINGAYIIIHQPQPHLFETIGKSIKQIHTQQRSHLHDQATGFIINNLKNDKAHDFFLGVSGDKRTLENCILVVDIDLVDKTLTVKKRGVEQNEPMDTYSFESVMEAVYDNNS